MSCDADGVWERDSELPGRGYWLFIGVVSTTRSNPRCTEFVPERRRKASLRAVGGTTKTSCVSIQCRCANVASARCGALINNGLAGNCRRVLSLENADARTKYSCNCSFERLRTPLELPRPAGSRRVTPAIAAALNCRVAHRRGAYRSESTQAPSRHSRRGSWRVIRRRRVWCDRQELRNLLLSRMELQRQWSSFLPNLRAAAPNSAETLSCCRRRTRRQL
jgi:hypothetical protein